jgi:hypothetical protein
LENTTKNLGCNMKASSVTLTFLLAIGLLKGTEGFVTSPANTRMSIVAASSSIHSAASRRANNSRMTMTSSPANDSLCKNKWVGPSILGLSKPGLSAGIMLSTLLGHILPSHAAAAASTLQASSALQTSLLALDQLLAGFSVGTTVWFFFIQSPFLLKILGKEKFTPTMMKLIELWAKTVSALFVLVQPLRVVLSGNKASPIMDLVPLAIGWTAIAVNRFVIVPRALQAGWKSSRGRKGDNSKDVKDFAVQGGGRTETKSLHQTVVLYVLIMSGGLVGHMLKTAAGLMY